MDMAAVRRSRSCYTGALTRAMDKLKLLDITDTAAIKALDVDDIERLLFSVEKTEKNFLLTGDEAQDFAPEGEEEEAFQVDETEIMDVFEMNASKAKKLANHLITLKGIQTGLAELTYDMSSLESTLTDLPDDDHTSTFQSIKASFSELRQEWKKTNLHEGHPLKKELDACTKDIHTLAANTASALHRAAPSTSAPTGTSSHSVGKDSTKLPAIDLPTFKGDVLQWPTFWQQFSASVDDRKDLPESTKLAYLRTAIKDPNSQLILNPSMDGPNTYKRLVKELHQRYRRTKKIHRELVSTLINLPAAKNNSTELRNLVDATVNCMDSLEATGHFTLATFITSLTYSKLPYKMQIDWDDNQADDDTILPFPKLLDYVTRKAFHLADHKSSSSTNSAPSDPIEKKPAKKQEPSHYNQKRHVFSVSSPASPAPTYRWECSLCSPEKHPLHACPKWLTYTLEQRMSHVSSNRLCANCLAVEHLTASCKSNYRCRDCGQAHHTTIHQSTPTPVHVSSVLSQSQQLPDALLMTAEVLLKGPEGPQLKARAFIDPGAGLSLISSSVAQALKLPLQLTRTTFSTVQGTDCKGSQHSTSVIISPLNNEQSIQCRPAVVQTVIQDTPSKQLAPVHDYPHLRGLQLADPTFNIPGRVDILLGADIWLQLQGKSPPITSSPSEPGAQDTIFGWAITGTAKAQGPSQQRLPTYHLQSNYVSFPISNYRHQMTPSEDSDWHPPGEDSSTAVLPNMNTVQQPWEEDQEKLPKLHTLTGPAPSSPEHQESSDSSLQHDLLPTEPLPLSPWKEEPPLPSEDLGLIPKQLPQKELLELLPSSSNVEQLPQKELLDLLPSSNKQQLPKKEPLTLPHPVDSSTTLSTRTSNLGNPVPTYASIPSHTDWCWESSSTFNYNGAPPLATANCLPLVISNHQIPATSSMHSLTSAEKKTAGLWLVKQAKLHLPTLKPSSILKNRLLSKSSRFMPWNPILNYSNRLATNYICHPLQQHQLIADSTTYWTYKWFRHPCLTLCLYGSLYFYSTDPKLLLLSARRLSRHVNSMPYWRNKPQLYPQLRGELPTVSNDCTTLVLHRRMDNSLYQNTAASEVPFLRFCTWNNLRQLYDLLTTLNSHYLLHLHLIKLLIRRMHTPAGTPCFETLWPTSVKTMMKQLPLIMDSTIFTPGNYIKPPPHRLPPGVCPGKNSLLDNQAAALPLSPEPGSSTPPLSQLRLAHVTSLLLLSLLNLEPCLIRLYSMHV